MNYTHIIGIDTGVNTGIAVWNVKDKSLEYYDTLPIHDAIFLVHHYSQNNAFRLLVRVEDARKRGNSTKQLNAMAQGVGSVKRDAKIWEDFLKDTGIDYQMLAPSKTTTKMNPKDFAKITGITKRTSSHCRDACMLVFKFR
jgi:hypothetical protein